MRKREWGRLGLIEGSGHWDIRGAAEERAGGGSCTDFSTEGLACFL